MANRHIEYKWDKSPQTCSHNYIAPGIFRIIKDLNFRIDSKILDAGCGGGKLISDLYAKGFMDVWGFDVSDSGIHLAKKSFPELADRFFKCNDDDPGLPENMPQAYDLIISMEVIEHLYSPEAYLANLYNWLNSHGYLIITTPYHGYLKNLAIALTNKSYKHFNPLSEGEHIKFFSRESLSFLLKKKGFDVIDFKGMGRIPYIWKSMILAARKKE